MQQTIAEASSITQLQAKFGEKLTSVPKSKQIDKTHTHL